MRAQKAFEEGRFRFSEQPTKERLFLAETMELWGFSPSGQPEYIGVLLFDLLSSLDLIGMMEEPDPIAAYLAEAAGFVEHDGDMEQMWVTQEGLWWLDEATKYAARWGLWR